MLLNNDIVAEIAKSLGFDLVGFSEVSVLEKEGELLDEWLRLNYQSGMQYMERNTDKRKDVKENFPEAKSVISLGMNYYTPEEHSDDKNLGKISRYAWGKDYHLIMWEKLDQFVRILQERDPEFKAKTYVDTGPVMDKVWAVRSGLGWMGKHTNVINRELGSWFFIATVICNYEFTALPVSEDFRGSCTACLDACPTGAIVEEYVVDANKCISYQTIENKGEISEELERKFENWIYGCDICQDVCPWNQKFSKITTEQNFYPMNGNKEINLGSAVSMEQNEFSARFKDSPVKRTKLKGLQRNALFLLNR